MPDAVRETRSHDLRARDKQDVELGGQIALSDPFAHQSFGAVPLDGVRKDPFAYDQPEFARIVKLFAVFGDHRWRDGRIRPLEVKIPVQFYSIFHNSCHSSKK
jgi:hypothetical protein